MLVPWRAAGHLALRAITIWISASFYIDFWFMRPAVNYCPWIIFALCAFYFFALARASFWKHFCYESSDAFNLGLGPGRWDDYLEAE